MDGKLIFEGAYRLAIVQQIRTALKSIDVTAFEWQWYEGQRAGTAQDINREVCTACRRDITIKALLHNEAKNRHIGKINRKTAGHLRKCGVDVKFNPMQKMLHAKLWIFDRKVAVLGSHNMSNSAMSKNLEVSYLVTEPAEIFSLCEWFDGIWSGGIPHLGGVTDPG